MRLHLFPCSPRPRPRPHPLHVSARASGRSNSGGRRPTASRRRTPARYGGGDVFAANRSAEPSYDDLFEGFGGKPQAEERKRSVVIEKDDLLGGFGRKPQAEEKKKPVVVEEDQEGTDFDDLIPGFAASSPPRSSGGRLMMMKKRSQQFLLLNRQPAQGDSQTPWKIWIGLQTLNERMLIVLLIMIQVLLTRSQNHSLLEYWYCCQLKPLLLQANCSNYMVEMAWVKEMYGVTTSEAMELLEYFLAMNPDNEYSTTSILKIRNPLHSVRVQQMSENLQSLMLY